MGRKGFTFGKKRRYKKSRGVHARSTGATATEASGTEQHEEIELESAPLLPGPDATNEFDLNGNGSTAGPNESFTSRAEDKFAHFAAEAEATNVEGTGSFYAIVHSSFLSALVSALNCRVCNSCNLTISASSKKGLAQQFRVFCEVCDEEVVKEWSSPQLPSAFDINYRTVLGCKDSGISLYQLKDLFSTMNMKDPLHHKSFKELSDKIHYASIVASEECMNKAAAVVRERLSAQGETAGEPSTSMGCPVTTVSYDGTWQKRGHSSHNGLGEAISVDTGLVLDAQVVSNYCAACEKGPKPGSPEYEKWMEKHGVDCNKNFSGSSNAMEAEAAKHIFSRSVQKRQLVYGVMLSDGDAKALCEVNKSSGYDIPVVKEDCINHISKRMFNALDNLKKTNKAALNRKLTMPMIEKLTNTYATNLKQGAPDVQHMKENVLGGFFHMMSTDESPNHRLCPKGETSWCHYQRSMALGQPVEKHRPTFSRDVGQMIYPILQRLTHEDLLQRCAKMGTQNANESFNSLIWKRCPKSSYASKQSVETATALSILSFNMGPSGIKTVMDLLGVEWGAISARHVSKKQGIAIGYARKRKQGMSKWKRKNLKKRRIQEEHQKQQDEGETYVAGAFNN